MEGVLVRRGSASLTRRRLRRARRSGATGIRQRCRIRSGAQEDVRGRVVSLSCGREHRWQEVWRGGAIDRAPPGLRWTPHVNGRGLVFGRAPNVPSGSPSGDHVMVAATPKLEVRRQAKLHLDGSSGKRIGRSPRTRHRRSGPLAQDEPVSTNEQRVSVAARGRDRESSDLQGARDGSRLQKSVRRIFPVANAGPPAGNGGAARGSPG